KLKLTRLEFLQSCALHALITENTISTVLEEPPISLPKVSKYTKEGLLAQCSNNVGRLEPLIDELDSMLGNAGAISGCIVDTISNLCASKDTISLKTVCNMLIRKISTLDIIMQYTQPPSLLMSLCSQLNDWTHDQDQTEFTPAYEEFASVLLFVLAAVHRYGLSVSDLGLPNNESFVAKVLQDTTTRKSPHELSEDQGKQLTKWIEGLYATDESGETGGISDEVMRQCPPQDFYLLVPTLFEQSVLACKSGTLSTKTFKGGLELLVEPFLLPSLVGGLSWLVKHSWEDHGDADILLQMLVQLLKPSSSSQETRSMHEAILGIIADPLYHSLQGFGQRQPNKKQPTNLMHIIKPYLGLRRTMDTNKIELDEWMSTAEGGLLGCIRSMIKDLVAWVSSVGPTPPPNYTYRLFVEGCKLMGVRSVKDALVAELKEQTKNGSGPFALDVCTALASAPLAFPQATDAPPSVRDALRLSTGDIQKLLHDSAADAESLVRLGRRVEAQLAMTQVPQLPITLPIQDQATEQVMAELGLTDDALPAGRVDTSMDQIGSLGPDSDMQFSNAELNSVLDQAMNPADPSAQNLANMSTDGVPLAGARSQSIFHDLDMGLDQGSRQMLNTDGSMNLDADGQQNAEEDIFAGLDMSLGDDFNFS
ncbi:hypothetical protein LTR37_019039, partial [Vermiconidia calcicola]